MGSHTGFGVNDVNAMAGNKVCVSSLPEFRTIPTFAVPYLKKRTIKRRLDTFGVSA
jgi:hypothetical protein